MQHLVSESARLELYAWILAAVLLLSVVYGAFFLGAIVFKRPMLWRKAHDVAILILLEFVIGFLVSTSGDPDEIKSEISRVASAVRQDSYTVRDVFGTEGRVVMVYTNLPAEGERGGILMRRESLDNFAASVKAERETEKLSASGRRNINETQYRAGTEIFSNY